MGALKVKVGGNWVDLSLASASTTPPTQKTYTSDGTWVKPAGLAYVEVEVIGGGGAGCGAPLTAATAGTCSAGGGAGGGGYAKKTFVASALGATEPLTVGVGGAGASGVVGGGGGDSTFSAGANLLTAGGGSAGSLGASSTVWGVAGGGIGGTASGGDINVSGTPGENSTRSGASSGYGISGSGGSSVLGAGGRGSYGATGQVGSGYGGGGGGTANNENKPAIAGGNGAPGAVIVTEYYSAGSEYQPNDTWTAAAQAATDLTTATMVDLPCSVTVPVTSTQDKFLVIGTADLTNQTATQVTATVRLNVGGVEMGQQIIFAGAAAAQRGTLHQHWLVGAGSLSTGDNIFKFVANIAGGTGTVRVQPQHTKFTVIKLASGGTSVGAVTAKMNNLAVQSITPTSTWVRMVVDNEIYDTAGMANPATGTITIPTSGKYAVWAYASFALNASVGTRRLIGLGKNWVSSTPTLNIVGSAENAGDSASNTGCNFYDVQEFAAGDVLTPLVWQNTGAALNTYLSLGAGNVPIFGASLITAPPGASVGPPDTGWIAATFTNGWTNYTGSTFSPAGYRRIGNMVYLRGLVVGTTGAASPMFTLPVGFRPPYQILLTAGNQVTTSSNASTGTAHTHTAAAVSTRLNVTAAGLVSVEATTASNVYTSLDGVSFLID